MIQLILGPMFSGKTTELLRRLTRSKIAGKKTILIRNNIDKRDHLTHDNKCNGNIEEKYISNLNEINPTNFEVIGIDEGQFFKDLYIYANKWANNNKIIIISALNGTSEQKPFEEITKIIPFAEEIDKLNAVCIKCGSDFGTYSKYLKHDKNSTIKVGGSESYQARCRNCLNMK